MGTIAIIDDDPYFRELLAENCSLMGHETFTAGSLYEAESILSEQDIDLVFLDVRLPDVNGLELLPQIRDTPSAPEVIIITGMGDENGANLAVTNGAWDYLQKPLSRDEIILQVERALEYHQNKQQTPSSVNLKRDAIIGESSSIVACLDQIASCAGTDTTVLLTGETGTGKELFAKAIHENSKRSGGPFIIVDCASLPEELIESLLFGHVKGAFTGAGSGQKGLIEQADGGTLFLDEVGELPLESQKAFLRVLQEQTYRPIGQSREIKSNFRLIAATNRVLEDMAAEKHFRSDLYYRLNGFSIHLPALRHREGDIEKLAMSFIYSICRREQIPVKGVVPETIEVLLHYLWPGNVRELKKTLEKSILADPHSPLLYPMHFPPEIRLNHIRSQVSKKKGHFTAERDRHMPETSVESGALPPFKDYKKRFQHDLEQGYLQRLMSEAEGHIPTACKISGLSRSRLYDLLKEHSLVRSSTAS